MSRRLYDGGATYQSQPGIIGLPQWSIGLNHMIFAATLLLALSQAPFIANVIHTLRRKDAAESNNPWKATTLEWQTSNPPPHGNFPEKVEVHRGPYEYSPTVGEDFLPQGK
jgi:cytochrome c oxidase subunit I